MVWLRTWLKRQAWFHKLVWLLDRIVIPGFERVSLLRILSFVGKSLWSANLTTRASSLAFKFFLAIFPSLIFLITLIPYVPIADFQAQLLSLLQEILPAGAFAATRETLEDLILQQHGGLLSFGFVFALYLATDGVHAMIKSFNQSDHTRESRHPLRIWLTAMLLVFILTLLLIISIGLIVFSEVMVRYAQQTGLLKDVVWIWLLQIGKWVITLGLFFFAISFLYWLGPDQRMRFRFISAGSTLATLFSIIISLGFAYYVNNFGTYNKLYGSIGTVMVVMLWMYFNSIALLMGYELNASLKALNRSGKKKRSSKVLGIH